MTRRRLAWIVPTLVVVLALAYSAWLVWQVQGELRAAESNAAAMRSAWRADDPIERDRAAAEFADQAAAADDHTSGLWWRALGHLPLVGDDADGVAAISHSLNVIAQDAVTPLSETVDALDGVLGGARIDLDAVADLRGPIRQAHRALVVADEDLADHDSDGYVDALRSRFDQYVDLVRDLRSGLATAETAVSVLPAMAGADAPMDYLLIFQNNAEIRATGGMPGYWAVLHADDGRIQMTRQGTVDDFPVASEPVLPLTAEELAVYGEEIGLHFQYAGWTADFPRAAELWQAHWDRRYPAAPIDGVVAIDPVGMSYLLKGTGPVPVDDVTLTPDNAVEELLSTTYIQRGLVAQKVFFAEAANAVFTATTSSLASPIDFADGLNRAASEGRLLVAAFDDRIADDLAGTRVEGALTDDDGATPHVDIAFNDLTGSKMSYYLRYNADVEAVICLDGVQGLSGTITMSQAIPPGGAAQLPAAVTRGDDYETDPGSQYVMVRIHGPYAGSIDRVRLDGRVVRNVAVRELDGRPVAEVGVLLSSPEGVVLTWQGNTGVGQTGAGQLTTTPSVVPGSDTSAFASACR